MDYDTKRPHSSPAYRPPDLETNPAPADSEAPPEEMSLPVEFLLFLRGNKKWWLIPIIVMVMLLGALLFFGSSPAAPFIYTLF